MLRRVIGWGVWRLPHYSTASEAAEDARKIDGAAGE